MHAAFSVGGVASVMSCARCYGSYEGRRDDVQLKASSLIGEGEGIMLLLI